MSFPTTGGYDRSNCQSNEIGGTFSADRRQIFNSTVVYQTPKFGERLGRPGSCRTGRSREFTMRCRRTGLRPACPPMWR